MSMNLTGRIMSFLGLSESARTEINKEIDLFEAVTAHVAWKHRLEDFLNGRSSETLEAHIVCMDNRCTLGKWIHGSGKARLGDYSSFKELEGEHAKFHFHASKVIEAHHGGDSAQAAHILSGEFAKQSKKTVDCITQLHMQVTGSA